VTPNPYRIGHQPDHGADHFGMLPPMPGGPTVVSGRPRIKQVGTTPTQRSPIGKPKAGRYP